MRRLAFAVTLVVTPSCRRCHPDVGSHQANADDGGAAASVTPAGYCKRAIALNRGRNFSIGLGCQNGFFTVDVVEGRVGKLVPRAIGRWLVGYVSDGSSCDWLVSGENERSAELVDGKRVVLGPDDGPAVRQVQAWTIGSRELWVDHRGVFSRLDGRPVGQVNLLSQWSTLLRWSGSPGTGPDAPVERMVMVFDGGEFGCRMVEVGVDAALVSRRCPTAPAERIMGARSISREHESCFEYVGQDFGSTFTGTYCLASTTSADASTPLSEAARHPVRLPSVGRTYLKWAWYEQQLWYAVTGSGQLLSFAHGDEAARVEETETIQVADDIVLQHRQGHVVDVVHKGESVWDMRSCSAM